MSAEDMGRAPRRLRLAFALMSVLFLVALAISPAKDALLEWKRYERQYAKFADSRAERKQLLADIQPGVDQIWIPELAVVDRCTTCHRGINQPSLSDPSVPVVFRSHSAVPHPVSQWGCVACHRGQGRATEMREAHETTLAWEEPLLPVRYIQASCGVCHRNELAETPLLNRGRQLLAEFNCVGCHRLQGIARPNMLGPDLTSVGTKVTRQWIYKWLKEPRTITDADGNITTNGVDVGQELRMPKFRLTEQELLALSGYLSVQKRVPAPPARFDSRLASSLQDRPDTVAQGEVLFRQMFCTTCHSIAITRAGQTTLIGGDIGPELTKVGGKVNTDWLVAWLRNPQSYLPRSEMPRYGWSDEDLFKVTRYIQTKLTDADLLSDVPSQGIPTASEIEQGQRLFVQKGCSSCHTIEGVPAASQFGPDLSGIGGRTVSQLEFGQSKIPRNLIAFIQAKITDPVSVNPAARMPQYHFEPVTLNAITTALLSMASEPRTPAWTRLEVPAAQREFHPAGEFGKLYERYKCYVCHQFNGYGGTLAPDLSFEGSRAQRSWLVSFLKSPQTVRPTLTVRMPQFNMTDHEAAVIADYLALTLQAPEVLPGSASSKDYTPQLAAFGKQLYEVKYQCQSCHTIGSSGGYVGPSLSNAGNWLTPEWIEAWLRDPQKLVPGAMEPRLPLPDAEVKALTAYLLTLRQSPFGKAFTGRGSQ